MQTRSMLALFLTTLSLGGSARAADSQLVWYQCTDSSQCIAVPGSCRGSWSAVNAHFKDEATSWAKELATRTECDASKDAGPPQAECLANKCMVKKGE